MNALEANSSPDEEGKTSMTSTRPKFDFHKFLNTIPRAAIPRAAKEGTASSGQSAVEKKKSLDLGEWAWASNFPGCEKKLCFPGT